MAYTDHDDLWLYDVVTDAVTRVTSDGDEREEGQPVLLGPGCVVHVTTDPTAIELVELGKSSRRVVSEPGMIADFDVDPFRGTVVYLQIDFDVDGRYRLKKVGLTGGEPVTLYAFDPNPGRGAGSEDEVSVTWDPTGSRILVANTHEDPKDRKTLHLFDASGAVLRRWTGTHPRWSPDGRVIYFHSYFDSDDNTWYALNLDTGKSRKLGIRPGTSNLTVSPDGSRVAYDTSWFGDVPPDVARRKGLPVVYVYDLQQERETVVRRNALGPLWVSATELLVTDAREPAGPSLNSWEATGTATKLSLAGQSSTVSLTSTLWGASVLLSG